MDNLNTSLTTPATTGQRVLAFIVDALVIGAVNYLLVSVTRSIYLGQIIGVAYLITKDALPFLDGQSIGKKALGIKVIKEDTGLSIKNDYQAGFMRALGQLIVVDYFYIFFSPDGKRLGDKFAGTLVVKV
jgi:uncharacterized RDD family membrane protein YckC